MREVEAVDGHLQADALAEVDLDATERHGDDSVSLLVTVRQQEAGMAALTTAILQDIQDDDSATAGQLFNVKTDYIKKKKSVCIRIGSDGIAFLDSQATMKSLALLSFSSLGTWTLTKPGRVALTLRSSAKPVTIVSKEATAIIQELNSWNPAQAAAAASTADIGVPALTAAGATISFSRRFVEDIDDPTSLS